MALQAKIGGLRGAVGRLKQLILQIGDVRIVAFKAIPNRRAVHVAFNLAGVLIAWQPRYSLTGVTAVSLMRVTSLFTRNSWQLKHPVAMAEWTAFPLVLSSWQVTHLAASVFGSSGIRMRFCLRGIHRSQHH